MDASTWCGEPVLVTTGAGWRLAVSPRRGGKIVSLIGGGVEWLAQPRLPLSPPAMPGAQFVAAEMCGWDECAPSIVSCVVRGRQVPDHGDLWTQRWGVDGEWLVASGPSFGYELARRVVALGRRIRLEYRARAVDVAVPFLWAAHPQFQAPAGSVVHVETATSRVVDVLAESEPLAALGPETCAIDTVEPGGCRKFYLEPGERATSVRLTRPDGAALSMTWDTAVTPYLGVWFDRGAYSHQDVIAIEPSTGYYDSLETALARGRVPVIEVGRELSWWCELSFEPVAGRVHPGEPPGW